MNTRKMAGVLVAMAAGLAVAGCQGPELETRTFHLQYIHGNSAQQIVGPYIYGDREGAPGQAAATSNAITVRETPDNLDKIARVLAEYDRPRPTVMLHFQVIEANGAADADPAIAEVEQELRRLFRFDGYRLLADAQVGGVENTAITQRMGEEFYIRAGIPDVRATTATIEVQLHQVNMGSILETTVTVPTGNSVVLGTTQLPGRESRALILVVRAEIQAPRGPDTTASG